MIALDRLEQITPAGIALANKSLAVALQQLSLSPMTTLSDVADAASVIRTCSDLPLVTDLASPVPSSVADYFAQDVAQGSGPNGTFVISDFFGTLAGITGLNYIAIVNILSKMNTAALQDIYETMSKVVNGTYGTQTVIIPSGTPGAGTYDSIDLAISVGLIPIAKTTIAQIVSLYPFQVKLLNNRWKMVDDQPAVRECLLQQKAGLDWSNFEPGNDQVMQAWIQGLPSQGLDEQPGGSHWFLQSIANVNTLAGQSIIGTLREGINLSAMNKSGLNNATQIPLTSESSIIATQDGNSLTF